MKWTEMDRFESAGAYISLERLLCEAIWAGEAAHITSEVACNPHRSVWYGDAAYFRNMADGSVWKLTKPDGPTRGSFVQVPDEKVVKMAEAQHRKWWGLFR